MKIVAKPTPPEWVSIVTKCRACVFYPHRLNAGTCSDHDCHGNRNKSRIDVYFVEVSE